MLSILSRVQPVVAIKQTFLAGSSKSVRIRARDEEIRFVEIEIGGEMSCQIPKALPRCVPSSPIEIRYLQGVGPVEEAENFA